MNLSLQTVAALLRKLSRKGGIDEAIAFTLLSRGWYAFSGLITLILLTKNLSRIEQGLYFTFTDVLGLQVFFELGMAHVLNQFASHERAGLEWTAQGTLEGDPLSKARLASLLRLIVRWYGIATLLLLLLLLPGGYYYFLRYAPGNDLVAWQIPWLWIVLATAGSLAISPLLALIEGCGLIAQLARMQVVVGITGSILFWVALWKHWGLYTAPVTNTTMFLGAACWLWLTKRHFFADLWHYLPSGNKAAETQAAPGHSIENDWKSGIDWKRELWPLQWKIALTWLSGYFIFRLFSPLLLAFNGRVQGPIIAGRMGLSLTLVSALAGIALAWITTKSAIFGTLIAKKEFEELDRRFFPCLWQSLSVLVAGSLLVWIGTLTLFETGSPLRLRILEPLPMALLLGAVIVMHIVLCESIYLRAHKQEPFLAMSLVWGGLILLSSLTLGRKFGATGMMLGYFVINTIVGLGSGTWIFVRKRVQWHTPDKVLAEGAQT